MKKLTGLFALLLLLCSCTKSGEVALVWSVWEADLTGKEYTETNHFTGEPETGTVIEGTSRIRFMTPGYSVNTLLKVDINGDGKGETNYESQSVYRLSPEQDYPTLSLPVPDSEKSTDKDLVVAYYIRGTFSEDNRSLHFDDFMGVRDVVFVRKL